MRRFLAGQLTLNDCRAALYMAFIGVLPWIGPHDVEAIRAIANANGQTIQEEMERRNSLSPRSATLH